MKAVYCHAVPVNQKSKMLIALLDRLLLTSSPVDFKQSTSAKGLLFRSELFSLAFSSLCKAWFLFDDLLLLLGVFWFCCKYIILYILTECAAFLRGNQNDEDQETHPGQAYSWALCSCWTHHRGATRSDQWLFPPCSHGEHTATYKHARLNTTALVWECAIFHLQRRIWGNKNVQIALCVFNSFMGLNKL